jgi:chromosome segregation ATPase
MSNFSETGDILLLKEKYDKLAQDYAKQRNKLTVLKKAYVELNEQATHKDQLIRKHEQEIESLSFRNKQLVTRISLLQEQSNESHLPLNGATNGSSDEFNVLREEFIRKINENALLHQHISDLESGLNEKSTKNHDDLKRMIDQNAVLQSLLDENNKKCLGYEGKIDLLENRLFFFDNISNFNENIMTILNLIEDKISILFENADDFPFELVKFCKNFSLNNRDFFHSFICSYKKISVPIFDRELKFYGSDFDTSELKRLNLSVSSMLDDIESTPDLEAVLKSLASALNEILILKHRYAFKQNLLTIDECLVFYLQKNVNLFIRFSKYLTEANGISNNNEELIVLDGLRCKCHSNVNLQKEADVTQQRPNVETNNSEPTDSQSNSTQHSIPEVSVDSTTDTNGLSSGNDLVGYYSAQINSLEASLVFATSKAICFYEELGCLKSLLDLNAIKLDDSVQYSAGLKSNIEKLNDELETVSRHYEDQLRMMSEHVAELNDKLAVQNEIIERSNANSKASSKKGK